MEKLYNWTAIFLIDCPADNTLSARKMFDDIFKLDIPDEICISICLHIPVASIRDIDPFYKDPVPPHQEGHTTIFYEVVRNTGIGSKLHFLSEDRNFDITSQQHIEGFFQSVIRTQQAYSYMLFTWGHGAAIGVFGAGSIQNSNSTMLRMTELKEANLNTFSDKMKLVVMMNCYMQYIDTGFLLRQAGVEYMVASEYGLTFWGYNYKAFFRTLYANTSISSRELATLTVSTLDSVDNPDTMVHAAIYATDLSCYDRLPPIMNKLGQQLSIELDTKLDLIHEAIKDDNYVNGAAQLIDLFVVIDAIAAKLGNNWQAQTIEDLHAFRKDLLIATFTGTKITPTSLPQVGGLAVCIPKYATYYFYTIFILGNPGLPSGIAGICGDWAHFIEKYVGLADTRKTKVTQLIYT